MPEHTVAQGECLSSLADSFKIPRLSIWNHPRNEELRKKRANPDTLFPGDVIYVPEKALREQPCATELRHLFVRKAATVQLRIRLLRNDQPRVDEPYCLDIAGTVLSGRTDGEGWLTEKIPAAAREGTLTLNDGAEQHNLQIGSMDPIEEISGIQGRLKNLGFYGADVDGKWGPESVDALRAFQQKKQLTPTGRRDEQTLALLQAEYGH